MAYEPIRAPLGIGAEAGLLERLWLAASYAYDVQDDPILTDGDWDELTKELLRRESELMEAFLNCVGDGLKSSTASGIDWSQWPASSVRHQLTVSKDYWVMRLRLKCKEAGHG